jgi:hypothetical protein
MRAGESFSGAPLATTGVTALVSSQFQLLGGKYEFAAVGTFNSGTITLQRIGPDGNTVLTAATALTTAGSNTADLPPGTYQVTISGSTTAALWWEVVRVPEE